MTRPEAPRNFGIVDRLRLRISSGEYPEGSKLPGEAVLAEQLQASRSTVRRAVAELGREGLLSAARGRGTFVRIRPDRRAIVIATGENADHEDLLDAAYDPTRRGWIPLWPAKRNVQQQTPTPSLAHDARDVRRVGLSAERAEILRLRPNEPVVLREQRWRHQENGYVIALSSFAPISLLSRIIDAPDPQPARPDGSARLQSAESPQRDLSSSPLTAALPQNAHTVAIYPELIAEHGPVTFTASIKARMPTVREREDLEMEVGVPLLIVTRTMLDRSGHPLEVTVLHAPADRFEVAQTDRKPILSL